MSTPKKIGIGGRIRRARLDKGWSQAALGSRIGARQTHVSKWEMGIVRPSATNLLRISKALSITVSYLLDGVDEEPIVQQSRDVDFETAVHEIGELLREAEKTHPGITAGFLRLLREGFLSTPEYRQDLLDLVRIFQRQSRYRRE